MPKPAYLTPEVEEFRRAFRGFVESEVVPQIPAWETAGAPSREFWRGMGRHGFLCPWLGEKDGGAEAPFGFSVVVCEELGRTGAMGIQTAVAVHSDITAPYLAELSEGEPRRRWLAGASSGDIVTAIGMTEPSAGSDLAAIRTTAVRDGDHFVLNGQKTFITNGLSCDLVIAVAKTDPKARHSGISLIVVEDGTPGFVKARRLEKMGQHAGDTAELFFEDCRVPVGNLLGA